MDKEFLNRWRKGLVYALLVAFCLAAAGFAVKTGYRSAVLVLRGERAVATCTRVKGSTSRGNANGPWYVAYSTAAGRTHEVSIDASFVDLDPGETIEILYDPRNPERAQANRLISLWIIPAVYGACALLVGRQLRATWFKQKAPKKVVELNEPLNAP